VIFAAKACYSHRLLLLGGMAAHSFAV